MEKQPAHVTDFYITREMQRDKQSNDILHLYLKKDNEGKDKSYIKYTNKQGEEVTVMMADVRRERLKKKIFQRRPLWITEKRSDGFLHVYDAHEFPHWYAAKKERETEK